MKKLSSTLPGGAIATGLFVGVLSMTGCEQDPGPPQQPAPAPQGQQIPDMTTPPSDALQDPERRSDEQLNQP